MRIKLKNGTALECEDKPLGRGGVGQVHALADGKQVVKLYFNPRNDLRQSLERIIDVYSDVAHDEWSALFRWPSDIVLEPQLGVLLPKLQTSVELAWLLNGRALVKKPVSWRSWQLRLHVALSLSMAVARLHGHGLAHSDLSPRNIFFDPKTGSVTLIDIDGLVVPDVDPPQVLGTPEYIAPEIVENAAVRPGIKTDEHSLAVLLYQLLLYRHPLRGPRVISPDPGEDDRHALGPSGLYIDHPSDDANRPMLELWDGFWPARLLGPQLAAMFERAFVLGLRDPNARPTAAEWLGALTRLIDRVVTCTEAACHERFFPLAEGMSPMCPWCRKLLAITGKTPVMHLYQSSGGTHYIPEPNASWWLVATEGRKLYEWHTTKGVSATPKALGRPAIAEVVQVNGVWKLRNLGVRDLKVIREGRENGTVPVGEVVRLDDGSILLLGPPPKGRAVVINRFEL